MKYLTALGSPGLPLSSRNSSFTFFKPPTRRSTLDGDSESEAGLTMALQDIPEIQQLPDSVSESPLFDMPREIRDRIYSFCLTARDALPVEWPSGWRRYDMQPQLLRICKIVYSEAAPVLYTSSVLTFQHPSDANMFVHALTSPTYGRHVTQVSLHIKAQDTRLWMAYISSSDPIRSLKADFPSLKELQIRYRSSKWQHAMPAEANMDTWNHDLKLVELVDGLRSLFAPEPEPDLMPRTESMDFADVSEQEADAHEPRRRDIRAVFEARRAQNRSAPRPADGPTVKVVCACRVHQGHFNALINPTPAGAPMPPGMNPPAPQSPTPVTEGAPFTRFTPIDLRQGVKKLHDPDLGSANVARTPFADMNGILVALEVHYLDPKGGGGERVV